MRKLLLVAAALAACAQYPSRPDHAATDFLVANPVLAADLEAAAADWADAGLEIANYVTINQDPHGVPVKFLDRRGVISKCFTAEDAKKVDSHDVDGCTEYGANRFDGLWIPEDLSPERRAVVLRHELIHLLVPDAEHLPNTVPAIFSGSGTSNIITMGDVNHLRHYAEFDH